jgi:hypothetical protein
MATSGELTRIVANALGVPAKTVREHLRNIRRTPNTITFTGYGRGAAMMTPRDAVRLLLAVVGSQFVKDSQATLDAFRTLQAIYRRDHEPKLITLEQHLVGLMKRVISLRHELPLEYERKPRTAKRVSIALTLMSGYGQGTRNRIPRVARAPADIATKTEFLSFVSPGVNDPMKSELDYALHSDADLIQGRYVTTRAFAKIALSL